MGNYFRSFRVVLIISLIFYGKEMVFSQIKYSENALTGQGNLNLIGENYKLQPKVLEAFKQMSLQAKKDGILIQIVSAYRSFDRQLSIWNRKYASYVSEGLTPQRAIEKIIEYSTIPGTSRHHWGTDIDIIDGAVIKPKELLIEENYNENGSFSKLKKWMDINSERFGFYLVYNNDEDRKGFKYEPWHYSYQSISKPMLKQFLILDLNDIIKENSLKGNKYITDQIIAKYTLENILDINKNLK
ncbi:M15 family metallopeptidase [Lutibacter aestuarii]|uniref:M15 family metallopeptidase n=1 Tax=Lutibacter aestuarii TaxID=861111 RepID=A0ABW2Z533_9FLAO